MIVASAPAKINLALVVGPLRPDGKHEVVSLLQPLTLGDRIALEPADETVVSGFPDDTIVTGILAALRAAAGHGGGWRVEIEKRIPVAAGLAGGSTDAAAALRLANATLPEPLGPDRLHAIAAAAGADVPFFLGSGAQLATGEGSTLVPVTVPSGYAVLVALPEGVVKESTGAVYRAFDARGGEAGFADRRDAVLRLVPGLRAPADLALLPPNDLASSPLASELVELGAFRADVSGAGPAVYGLFENASSAEDAAVRLRGRARTWVAAPR
jgi:4-diphosphocytidyl-2-C-methyl-D-erythritol kinase